MASFISRKKRSSALRFCFPRRGLISVVGAAVALSVFLLFAATETKGAATESDAVAESGALVSPIIIFDPNTFDFGYIFYGQPVVHRFQLLNGGRATLRIQEVRPSCGCTSIVIGKRELEPAESTEIEATFLPESASGLVHKSILVASNDPSRPLVSLHFKANILPAPTSSKPSLSFHQVDRTREQRATLLLPAPDGHPLELTEIRLGDAPYLSVYPRREGEATFLDVVLDGMKLPKDADRGQTRLTVFTSDEALSSVLVSIDWDAKP